MALNVISKDLTTPPGAPADGDTYLIYGVGAVGTAWEGWQGLIATWTAHGAFWTSYKLSAGNVVYCLDDSTQWIQTDDADPPTWMQLTKAVDALAQIQLVVLDTTWPGIGMQYLWVRSPFNGVISTWELVADVVGNITLDVHKAPYAAAPPAGASMVGAGVKPTLVGAIRNTGDTSTWTGSTTVVAGEYLRLELLVAAGVTHCSLALMV